MHSLNIMNTKVIFNALIENNTLSVIHLKCEK